MRLNETFRILRSFVRSPRQIARIIRWLGRNPRQRRQLAIGGTLALLATIVVGELTLEPRHLPWRPLAIDDRAGFATDMKLGLISAGPESWCERLVSGSDRLQLTPLEAHDGDGTCGWSSAIHIDASGPATLTGKSTYAMRCKLAAGAHIWMTSIDHRARSMLGSGLAKVHHAGTYSCRRMYNRRSGRMSQHAYANAWDVTGFELDDGRVVSVREHWRAGGEIQAFLHGVRDDACSIFRVVLGPDYNAEHHDHFHVDMGYGLRCK